MAVGDVDNRKSKLTLRQEVETDKFSNQTLANVNPAITDEKAWYFGGKLGDLCSVTLEKVIRTDTMDIAIS